ncbi:MAG TPA: TIGR00269 family protein [Methanoculleus sp.]|nr:TIGR00269 family protein [Methanoculleus sp.]
MKCRKCSREAVIFQQYSGLHLCERHFTINFEARAKRAIRKHQWIQPGDRIAVAMSGGKDSSALLYFLTSQFGARRDVEFFAICIDEGIAGYRDPAVAERIAASRGVPFYTVSFADAYGLTVDEIVERRGDAVSCSYCGVLRRHLLNRIARELGATKIALGFNLDDDAQSVLMNVLRGDLDRLVRPTAPVEGLVPRIRPFRVLPEREVALYAHLHLSGFEEEGCPYSHNALRADVRTMLNDYNYRHPATKFALVRLGEELANLGGSIASSLHACEECGEPCTDVCRACQILREFEGK